jgi:hypothetical protein
MSTTYAVGQRLTASILQTLADATVNRAVVRLVATSTQNLTNNTSTAITFGASSTIIDTAGLHSEVSNTSRVTPTTAGYYLAWGAVVHGSRSDYTSVRAAIRFNGTDQAGDNRVASNTTAGTRTATAGPVMLLCNGTTDYIEISGLQVNSATATQATSQSGSSTSFLEVEFLRPA